MSIEKNNMVSIQKLQRALIKIANILTDTKKKIKSLSIKYGGGSFYTETNHLQIGLPEELRDKPETKNITICMGLFLHEYGHHLFSSFEELEQFCAKCARAAKKNTAFMSKLKKGQEAVVGDVIKGIAAKFNNSIEDGRIEFLTTREFPGAKNYIQSVGLYYYEQDTYMPCSKIAQALLSFCYISKLGIIPKWFEEVEDDVRALVKKHSQDILGISYIGSVTAANKKMFYLFEKILPFILDNIKKEIEDAMMMEELKKLIEEAQKEKGSYTQRGDKSETEDIDGSSVSSPRLSEAPMEYDDDEETDDGDGKGAGAGEKSETEDSDGKDAGAGDESGKGKEDESGKKGKAGKEEKETASTQKKQMTGSVNSKGKRDFTQEEIEEIKKKIEQETNKEAKIVLESAKKEIEEEEKTSSSLTTSEKEHIESLYKKEVVSKFKETIFEGVLSNAPPEIVAESKQLRDVLKKVEETPRETRNQHSGKISLKSLYRVGAKKYDVFKKRIEPNPTNLPVISIVWDGSGSMHGYEKQEHSTIACSSIEEATKNILPLKITNFDTSRQFVNHTIVKDFDENPTQNKAYSFGTQKRFGGGNKDGFSIRVCAEELSKRKEQKKILIVLSDGMPTDYNGGVKAALEDVKAAVNEARKKGIILIAVFFGDENTRTILKEDYKFMYEKNLISCDVNDITKNLTKLVKNLSTR